MLAVLFNYCKGQQQLFDVMPLAAGEDAAIAFLQVRRGLTTKKHETVKQKSCTGKWTIWKMDFLHKIGEFSIEMFFFTGGFLNKFSLILEASGSPR